MLFNFNQKGRGLVLKDHQQKEKYTHIVYASAQSISSNLKEFKLEDFGCLVIDACVIIRLNTGKLDGIGA